MTWQQYFLYRSHRILRHECKINNFAMSEMFAAKTSLGYFDGCCLFLGHLILFRDSNMSSAQIQHPPLCFFFLCTNTGLLCLRLIHPMEQPVYVNRRLCCWPRKVGVPIIPWRHVKTINSKLCAQFSESPEFRSSDMLIMFSEMAEATEVHHLGNVKWICYLICYFSSIEL